MKKEHIQNRCLLNRGKSILPLFLYIELFNWEKGVSEVRRRRTKRRGKETSFLSLKKLKAICFQMAFNFGSGGWI